MARKANKYTQAVKGITVEVRGDTWTYKAVVKHLGTGGTDYYRFDGRWILCLWDSIPKKTYRALRAELKKAIAWQLPNPAEPEMNATKIAGNAFLVNHYPGYSVAVKMGGKTLVHERRFTNRAEATILSMKVSGKGEIDAAHWTEQEIAPFIMFRAA